MTSMMPLRISIAAMYTSLIAAVILGLSWGLGPMMPMNVVTALSTIAAALSWRSMQRGI